MMNCLPIYPEKPIAGVLQSGAVCCNLQSACKLNLNKISNLFQFADCRDKIAESVCNLLNIPYKSIGYTPIPDCTQTSSPYGRGEPQRGALNPNGRDLHSVKRFTLLALDLGTQTGWALSSGDRDIISGSESFKPSRFDGGGMRYLRFKRWLTELKSHTDGIDAIYFEEVRRHAGVDAAHAYGGFMAHLTAWCEHHGIPYQGVPVGTIKKHATGKGNASKELMIKVVEQRGHQPVDDNEADAIALLYWALDTQEVSA